MNAKELLIHDCRQRQCTEGVHASFVYSLGVFVLTLKLEGEVIGQVAALVVAAKQPKAIWVPNFKSPQIQDTLSTIHQHRHSVSATTLVTSMLKYPRST